MRYKNQSAPLLGPPDGQCVGNPHNPTDALALAQAGINASDYTSEFLFYGGGADFVYVPRAVPNVVSLLRLWGPKLIMEIASPSAIVFACGRDVERYVHALDVYYNWDGGGLRTPLEDVDAYHPVKLRVVEKGTELIVETTAALSHSAKLSIA